MWVPLIFSPQLFNDLFKNNANRSETSEKKYNQNYFMEMITVEGVYDYLMYVGKCSLYSQTIFITMLQLKIYAYLLLMQSVF